MSRRNWPKVSIEVGGPPPRRGTFNPWFFCNWFGGNEHSRRQFSLYGPFVKVRIYP